MQGAIYATYYTGVAGSGMGLIALVDGTITGADVAGGIYDGSYSVDRATGEIVGQVRLRAPAGTILVTGGMPPDGAVDISFPIALPRTFESGIPVKIRLPTGPVNAAFRKLRDFGN